MEVLFIGKNNGNAELRAKTIERLGHNVHRIAPESFLPKSKTLAHLIWMSGGTLFEREITDRTISALPKKRFDLVWVHNNRLVGSRLLAELRKRSKKITSYINDNPFENSVSWNLYLKSIPFYDSIAVVRGRNVEQAKKLGAKKVIRIYFSADEIVHSPKKITLQEKEKLASDVLFVGTCFEDRAKFLEKLVNAGIPLTIYGNQWEKAKEFKALKNSWKGPGIEGEQYTKVIQSAKICIGLLSKKNKDVCTSRSVEIPAIGSLLCAERTEEHKKMYNEGKEAVFWGSAEECVEKCKWLLSHPKKIKKIAAAGKRRSKKNGFFNEKVVSKIIEETFKD